MKKSLVIDSRMYPESKLKLAELGFNLIEIPRMSFLDIPVSCHPDMLMTVLNNIIFTDIAIHILFTFVDDYRIEQINAFNSNVKAKYPQDVKFNCAVVGKKILCNTNNVADEIKSFAINNGFELIHTNQGYAKCSTAIVSDDAVITEDESIENVCIENGIDVLKITKGFVKLNGYDYGFIGGCCGLIENKILAFNGNIKEHPEYNQIYNFCKKHDVTPINLCDLPLYDVGSIIRL